MKRGAAAAALRMLLLLLGQQTLHEGYTPSSGCDVIADTVIIIMIILEQAKERERERDIVPFVRFLFFVQLLFYFIFIQYFSLTGKHKKTTAQAKNFMQVFVFFLR